MTTFNAKINLNLFGRSLGNGATMGALFCDGVLHAMENKNTNHIAAMYSKAKAQDDGAAMRAIKATVLALYSGNDIVAQIKDPTDANAPIVIKTKGCAVNDKMVKAMKLLVVGGKSMRAKVWGDTFKSDDDKTKKSVAECQVALDKFLQKLAADNGVEITGSVVVVAPTLQIAA